MRTDLRKSRIVDICREISFKEGLSVFVFFYNKSLSLHMIVVYRVRLSFLDSIFSNVEDKLEFMGEVIGHE